MAKKIYSRKELAQMESDRKDYVNDCLHKNFNSGDSVPVSIAVAACGGLATPQELIYCSLVDKRIVEGHWQYRYPKHNYCLEKSLSTHTEWKTVKYAELDDDDNIVTTFTREKRVRFIDID